MQARRRIEAALRRAAERMIAEVLALLPPEAGTGRGARPVEQAPARRIRRPAERLERLAGEVLGVLARRSGLAVSEIAHSIGATPREITRPITWLLGRGAITKTGERRGTRYYLARRAPAARTPAATRPSAPSRKKPRRRRG